MINTSQYKAKAISLRKKGLSYNEISKKVPVAKSTLSLWLKDLPLKKEDRERLYTKQVHALNSGPKSQKERREKEVAAIIETAKRDICKPLSYETFRLVGAALYWAEGNKGKRCAITNSDPSMIVFMVRWFEKILGVLPSQLTASLNIYPQQNEKELKTFWSDLTGIPLSQFRKSYIKPLSKGYKNNNLYYGTIRVEVPKSTDYVYQIFGWVKAAVGEVTSAVEATERKWEHLKKIVRPANIAK